MAVDQDVHWHSIPLIPAKAGTQFFRSAMRWTTIMRRNHEHSPKALGPGFRRDELKN
jgi:hypothetical protein